MSRYIVKKYISKIINKYFKNRDLDKDFMKYKTFERNFEEHLSRSLDNYIKQIDELYAQLGVIGEPIYYDDDSFFPKYRPLEDYIRYLKIQIKHRNESRSRTASEPTH